MERNNVYTDSIDPKVPDEFDKEGFIKEMADLGNIYEFFFGNEANTNHNKDLDCDYTLKLKKHEAIRGVTKTIKVKGKKIEVKIPNNLQDGQRIVIAHEGERQGEQYGNLIVTVKIRKW